jgi:hypothetical protein
MDRLFGQIAWDVTFTRVGLSRTPRAKRYEIELGAISEWIE